MLNSLDALSLKVIECASRVMLTYRRVLQLGKDGDEGDPVNCLRKHSLELLMIRLDGQKTKDRIPYLPLNCCVSKPPQVLIRSVLQRSDRILSFFLEQG